MSVNVKAELEKQAATQNSPVKLTKNMTIAEMVKALEPEIRKALPAVITPERFTRMALSAINNTPQLAECTPLSFVAALLNAAQLGYKGLIDLAYRTGQVQVIQAQVVREHDYFEYQYGLDSKLIHRPGEGERGNVTFIYGLFKLTNGGYGFEVCNKPDMDSFAVKYSKSFGSSYSPWSDPEGYQEMAKKTVIERALKYAPVSFDFQRALSTDETIKRELSVDMSEIQNQYLPDQKIPA